MAHKVSKLKFNNVIYDLADESSRVAINNLEGQLEAARVDLNNLDGQLETTIVDLNNMRAAVGSPLTATTISAMTDTNKIYVYTGNTTTVSGVTFTAGNWYYHDGTRWQLGGVYNETALETDTTLTVSGAAADAKVTGDEVTELKNDMDVLNSGGLVLKDDVIGENVESWLNSHPEATTTVQDGSLTWKKLYTGTLGYITPEMYGAYGDGVHDDSTALQHALNRSNEETNTNVIYLSKDYFINSLCIIYSNTVIFGPGVLRSNRSANGKGRILYALNESDITIDGVKFIGDAVEGDLYDAFTYNQSLIPGCITFENCENITIKLCNFVNIKATAACCFRVCDNFTFDSNYIYKYVYAGVQCLTPCSNGLIIGNSIIEDMGPQAEQKPGANGPVNTYPIGLAGGDNQTTGSVRSYRMRCIANYIWNSTPHWEGIDAHGLRDSVISENVIINCAVGIAVVPVNAQEGVGWEDSDARDILISNNVLKITNSTAILAKSRNNMGIVVAGKNLRGGNVSVVNNVVQGFGINASKELIDSSVKVELSGYIKTDSSTTDYSVISDNTYVHSVTSCSGGDCFTFVGTGGSSGRLWAFVNESGTILSRANANISMDGTVEIEAPANSVNLVVNSISTATVLKKRVAYKTTLEGVGGIRVYGIDNCFISNNSINGCVGCGMSVLRCTNLMISNNIIRYITNLNNRYDADKKFKALAGIFIGPGITTGYFVDNLVEVSVPLVRGFYFNNSTTASAGSDVICDRNIFKGDFDYLYYGLYYTLVKDYKMAGYVDTVAKAEVAIKANKTAKTGDIIKLEDLVEENLTFSNVTIPCTLVGWKCIESGDSSTSKLAIWERIYNIKGNTI